jgi:hypothetical protein
MAYIYKHIRKDNQKTFYIGVGTTNDNFKRAYNKIQRNKQWKDITNLVEYDVVILEDGLSINEAHAKECQLIKQYGRIDLGNGTLCNLSDGGYGNKGWIPNEKWRKSHSEKLKGRKMTKEWRQKLSESKIGKTGENHNSVKLLVNIESGIFYFGVNDAAKSVGINPKTLYAQLSGSNKNKTFLKYA